MSTIYCRIRGQDLNLSVPTPVVANTVDYISINAMFTDEWKSAIKWVFLNQGGTTYRLMMENDNILPDKHLNLNAGKWNIWLMGDITVHGNLTTRITTNVVEFTVLPSGFIDDNILNVPPDVGEQIIAIAQAALEKSDDTAEKMAYFEYRANRGDFNGKQGERGLQGEQGEQGIQGIQGVSGVYVGTGEIPEGFNVKINPEGDGTIIIEDAPEDNKEYVRKNGEWVQNSGGSGGTSDHRELTNRDATNQHPMSAITGLGTALADKADADMLPLFIEYGTSNVYDAINAAWTAGVPVFARRNTNLYLAADRASNGTFRFVCTMANSSRILSLLLTSDNTWSGSTENLQQTTSSALVTTDTTIVGAINEVANNKLDKTQGASHAGEFLVVGSDGEVTTQAFSVLTGGNY